MKSTMHALKKATLVGSTALALSLGVTQVATAGVGTINKGDLSGTWQLTLNGKTGCGNSAMLAVITLNGSGVGTADLTTHGDCGDSTVAGVPFTITSLNGYGTGVANLSCGPGCGWNLSIQVSPDRATFNAVDIDPSNPGNFISGVAIHR